MDTRWPQTLGFSGRVADSSHWLMAADHAWAHMQAQAVGSWGHSLPDLGERRVLGRFVWKKSVGFLRNVCTVWRVRLIRAAEDQGDQGDFSGVFYGLLKNMSKAALKTILIIPKG